MWKEDGCFEGISQADGPRVKQKSSKILCCALKVTIFLELEFNFWQFSFFRRVELEEFLALEAHRGRDDVGRKDFDLGVEVADVGVVKAPGSLNLIFSVGQFILQLQE